MLNLRGAPARRQRSDRGRLARERSRQAYPRYQHAGL